MFTRDRFQSCLVRLGLRPAADLFPELLAAYSADDRFYHNVDHIGDCLAHLERRRSLACRPDEVELAVWFHDAVYDSRRNDNEERSAAWATEYLRGEGLDDERIRRVAALILATRHDARPEDTDQQLLADIDLAILGQPPRRFADYDSAIRREYAWVPWPQYRSGRLAVLQGFLARDRIYATDAFHDAYERTARDNLQRVVDELQRD